MKIKYECHWVVSANMVELLHFSKQSAYWDINNQWCKASTIWSVICKLNRNCLYKTCLKIRLNLWNNSIIMTSDREIPVFHSNTAWLQSQSIYFLAIWQSAIAHTTSNSEWSWYKGNTNKKQCHITQMKT